VLLVDFYSAAAQIIPVLFLAAVVEGRLVNSRPDSYFSHDPDNPKKWNGTQPVGRIYAVLIMAIGQLLSLVALSNPAAARAEFTRSMIWLALAVGLGAVAYPVLARQVNYWRRWAENTPGSRSLAVYSVVALVVLTFSWVMFFPGLPL
jgi:hypothetical protein